MVPSMSMQTAAVPGESARMSSGVTLRSRSTTNSGTRRPMSDLLVLTMLRLMLPARSRLRDPQPQWIAVSRGCRGRPAMSHLHLSQREVLVCFSQEVDVMIPIENQTHISQLIDLLGDADPDVRQSAALANVEAQAPEARHQRSSGLGG